VSLRAIQQYEQGQKDIRKAQAASVQALAKALGCDVEYLLAG
jgi:transcriptional regulator with XRE-family HTH domain